MNPFAIAAEGTAVDAPQFLELPLGALLQPYSEEQLGFDPDGIPEHVTTRLALDVVKPQIASGKVAVTVAQIAAGCEERFHPAFANSDRALRVRIPLQDVFRYLPPGSLAPRLAQATGSPQPVTNIFDTPFSIKAREDEESLAPAPGLPASLPPFPSPVAAAASPPVPSVFPKPFSDSPPAATGISPFAPPFAPPSGAAASPVSPFAGSTPPNLPGMEGHSSAAAEERPRSGLEFGSGPGERREGPRPEPEADSESASFEHSGGGPIERPAVLTDPEDRDRQGEASDDIPKREARDGLGGSASADLPAADPPSPFALPRAPASPFASAGALAQTPPVPPAASPSRPTEGGPLAGGSTAGSPFGLPRTEPTASGTSADAGRPSGPPPFTPVVGAGPVADVGSSPARGPFAFPPPRDGGGVGSGIPSRPLIPRLPEPPAKAAGPPEEDQPHESSAEQRREAEADVPSTATARSDEGQGESQSIGAAPSLPSLPPLAPLGSTSVPRANEPASAPPSIPPAAESARPTSPPMAPTSGESAPAIPSGRPGPPSARFVPAGTISGDDLLGDDFEDIDTLPIHRAEAMPASADKADARDEGAIGAGTSEAAGSVEHPPAGSDHATSDGLAKGPSPSPEDAAVPHPEDDFSFGYVADESQTALRAVFGTDEKLDLTKAVALSSGLPGIAACVFMHGDEMVRAGDANGSSGFVARAPEVYENVRNLAAVMGAGDATSFTIRTDHGIMSFFTERDACLGVLHANSGFLPGVREKLTLVTRELSKLALPS